MRPRIERLRLALDEGRVELFQLVVYLAFVKTGLEVLIVRRPPEAVEQTLWAPTVYVWAVLLIVCPVMTIGGLAARHWPFALWLRLGGNTGVGFTLAAYAWSVAAHPPVTSRATWALDVAEALALCAFLLAYRNIRQLRRTERRRRARGGSLE